MNRFANALLTHGIKPHERVAMLMSNGVPMVHALFGTMNAGAVSVPLNVSISDEAALGMLHDSGAPRDRRNPDQRARIDALRNRLGDVRLFLLAGRPAAGWTCWETFIADRSPRARRDPDR